MAANETVKQRLEALKADLKKKAKKLQVISRIKKTKEHVRKTLKAQADQEGCAEVELPVGVTSDGPPEPKDRKLSVSFVLEPEVVDTVCPEQLSETENYKECLSQHQNVSNRCIDKELGNANIVDAGSHTSKGLGVNKLTEKSSCHYSVHFHPTEVTGCIAENQEGDAVTLVNAKKEISEKLDEKTVIPGTQYTSASHKKPLLGVFKSENASVLQLSVNSVKSQPDSVDLNDDLDSIFKENISARGKERVGEQSDISTSVSELFNRVSEFADSCKSNEKTSDCGVQMMSSKPNSMGSMSEWQAGSEEDTDKMRTHLNIEEQRTVKVVRKRTRKSFSTEVVDFSFLEEGDSGDMYSGIKSRRRSLRRSKGLTASTGCQESPLNSPGAESSLSGGNRDSEGTNTQSAGPSKLQVSRSVLRRSLKKGRTGRRFLATERLHTALAILVNYATSAVEQCAFSLPLDQFGYLMKDKCAVKRDDILLQFSCSERTDNDLCAMDSSSLSSLSSSQEPIPSSQVSQQQETRKVLVGKRTLLHCKGISAAACDEDQVPACCDYVRSPIQTGDSAAMQPVDEPNSVQNEVLWETKDDNQLYSKSCNFGQTSDETKDGLELVMKEESAVLKVLEYEVGTKYPEKLSGTKFATNDIECKMKSNVSLSPASLHIQERNETKMTLRIHANESKPSAICQDDINAEENYKGPSSDKLLNVCDIQLKDEYFIDAKCGRIKVDGIRKNVFIIATEHQLHFWLATGDPLSWHCLFSWSFSQMNIMAIHSLSSDREVSLVFKAQSSIGIQVFHLSFISPDVKSFIHIASAGSADENMLISAIGPTAFVISSNGHCVYYEIDTCQKDVKKEIVLEKSQEGLVSFHPLEGTPHAVVGFCQSAIYVWNNSSGHLVFKLELPAEHFLSRCLHASSEKGVLALLFHKEDHDEFVVSALISNPVSGRKVLVTLWEHPCRFQLMDCKKEMLVCSTSDNKLQLLSTVDGKVISEIVIADGLKGLKSTDGCENIIACYTRHCSIFVRR